MISSVRTEGASLGALSSIGIGGVARELWQPHTLGGLADAVRSTRGRQPFFLGGGCNTLFPDGEFERPVIATGELTDVEISGCRVRVEAGVRIDRLIRATVEAGLAGLEGLVGIPGTAGGGTVMNAGGSGGNIGDAIVRVEAVDLESGEIHSIEGREIPWAYRSWGLSGLAVAAVEFQLSNSDRDRLRERSRQIFLKKSRTQPLAQQSAGCVFKNPAGRSAGAMIEQLGLKGARRGGAAVSERHANFIVNQDGAARAADVRELIAFLQDEVEREFGLRLETEIVIVEACLQ